MASVSELPWPQCLGPFDEESCLFFLSEIGRRVVPFYPFQLGMEQVHGLILDRYGYDGATDAMSVLQELLQNDDVASGLGDDGDIWRSWRHAWRHRNDDPHNPYIPRVGCLILQPPTMPSIRHLKASNFEQSQSNTSFERRCILAESISPSSFCDLDIYRERSTNTSLLKPLRANKHRKTGDRLHLRGGEASAKSPQLSLPLTFHHGNSFVESTSGVYGDHCTTGPVSVVSIASGDCKVDSTALLKGVQDLNSAVNYQHLPLWDKKIVAKQPITEYETHATKQTHPTKTTSDGCILHARDLAAKANRSFDHHKRAQNRQAQLVDGTLLHAATNKCRSLHQQDTPPLSSCKIPPQKISRGDSNRDNPTNTSRRTKWLRNLRSVIHRDSIEEKSKFRQRHRSFPMCSSSVSTFEHTNMPVNHGRSLTSDSAATDDHTSYRFGVDGSMDAPAFNKSTSTSFNSDKPLPPSPTEFRPSVSSETQRAFFSDNLDMWHRPSTSSTCYSNHSKFSTDQNSGVLRSSVCHYRHHDNKEYASSEARDETSEKVGCSLEHGQKSPISFTSFTNKNPFLENGSPRVTLDPPSSMEVSRHQISSDEWPFRSVEESTDLPTNTSAYIHINTTQTEPKLPLRETTTEQVQTEGQHTRGRQTLTDQGSPACGFGSQGFHSHSRSRSPSPVRKLLGLGKSRTPDCTLNRKQVETPSSSNRKWTLREWGNKIRHGFLTADQNQLQQEDLMEQNSRDNIVIVPPSNPSRSIFSVSLRPPDQAKVIADIELFVSIAANSFLKREAHAGRISSESVAKAKLSWEARSKPQAIEFLFDIGTQRNLVVANLQTVNLCGDAANDPIALCSTLQAWKVLVREISPRALCNPDSMIRRWMHDTRRVLEILGCGNGVMFACDTLSLATYKAISDKERQRAQYQGNNASMIQNVLHHRSASEGGIKGHSYERIGQETTTTRGGDNNQIFPRASKSAMTDTYARSHKQMDHYLPFKFADFNSDVPNRQTAAKSDHAISKTALSSPQTKPQLISPQDALIAAGCQPRFVVE